MATITAYAIRKTPHAGDCWAVLQVTGDGHSESIGAYKGPAAAERMAREFAAASGVEYIGEVKDLEIKGEKRESKRADQAVAGRERKANRPKQKATGRPRHGESQGGLFDTGA